MNDYNATNDGTHVPCEGTRLPAIVDVTKKNGELAIAIAAGMSVLLGLLVGPEPEGNCDTKRQLNCLLDEVAYQNDILCEIQAKLHRAIAVLTG